MKACIHRGAHEIGGTCVELLSDGKRLVLDVGLPLNTDDADAHPLHPVPGFERPDSSLLGVCISHPHQDHYGLAHRLPNQTPFLIGGAARSILAAAELFSPAGLALENVIELEHRRTIQLGPFAITPYLVDHSAYDSYAVLVRAEGRGLFYTGDLRAHGRKAALFQQLVADPPDGVDVLLMEGTTLARPESAGGYPSESDLEQRLAEIFRQTAGMPLVRVSGQNIDRLVSIFRACLRSGRQLILDMYSAHVLRATGNPRLPQAEWAQVRVFLPHPQRMRIIAERAFEVSDSFKPDRIHWRQLAAAASRSVMLFRPNMIRDLERADCLGGACLVHSMWGGYLEEPKERRTLEWLERRGIPLHRCHTSGHASAADLLRLRRAFAQATAVPIHLEDRERFAELFPPVRLHDDGAWWDVSSQRVDEGDAS